jgi:ABC-type proline/glycine betaine transport system permease subunit
MPELPRVPLGDWVEALVDWLGDNASWLFDAIRAALLAIVERLDALLASAPAFVFIVLAALLAWRVRGRAFAAFTLVAFTLIVSMELWEATIVTLALVLVSTLVALVIAVPLGIASARNGAVSAAVRPVLDFMQTLPAFVYLIPAITFFRIGTVPGLVATLIFALPPGVRFTELGIRQVDEEVVEAARAFGATPRLTLTRVQIPLAMPTIMGGINQVIMLALSMVVIAGMVGAGGLGSLVFRAITRLNIGLGFEAGLAVVILAIFLDRLTGALAERARPEKAG